jgi:hypothetical protein
MYTPISWAKEAVAKHTWKDAYRIALQCQKTGPHPFFTPVSDWIKKNAPPGALEQ